MSSESALKRNVTFFIFCLRKKSKFSLLQMKSTYDRRQSLTRLFGFCRFFFQSNFYLLASPLFGNTKYTFLLTHNAKFKSIKVICNSGSCRPKFLWLCYFFWIKMELLKYCRDPVLPTTFTFNYRHRWNFFNLNWILDRRFNVLETKTPFYLFY